MHNNDNARPNDITIDGDTFIVLDQCRGAALDLARGKGNSGRLVTHPPARP